MSSVSCSRCRHLLAPDAAFCPNCGAPVPEGPATFVLEPAGDQASETRFAKPAPEPRLGWGPIAVGLAALLLVAAIVVSLNGTGRNVALAPTPTPAPKPTPTTAPTSAPTQGPLEAPDSAAEPDDSDATEPDDSDATELNQSQFGPAATESGAPEIVFGDSFPSLPLDFLRVEPGSSSDDYVEALRSLARSFGLAGTIVFANDDEATRLDLASGRETRIPLDGRKYILGGRNGIVTDGFGPMVAQRWDEPEAPVELDDEITHVSGPPWLDPNGSEIARYYRTDDRNGFIAPWATPPPEPGSQTPPSPPTKQGGGDVAWPWPVELYSPHPRRWTWDKGDVPLPWDAVLAEYHGHLLVRTCEGPGRCHNAVVDNDDEVLARVDASLAGTTLNQRDLVLSTKATVAAFRGVRIAEITGSGLIAPEIIDLESGRRTNLPAVDLIEVWSEPFWLGDALLVLPLYRSEKRVHLLFDRNGVPRAELYWQASTESGDLLTYFAPED